MSILLVVILKHQWIYATSMTTLLALVAGSAARTTLAARKLPTKIVIGRGSRTFAVLKAPVHIIVGHQQGPTLVALVGVVFGHVADQRDAVVAVEGLQLGR